MVGAHLKIDTSERDSNLNLFLKKLQVGYNGDCILGVCLKSPLLSHNIILRFPFSILAGHSKTDKLSFLWNITFSILSIIVQYQ